MSSLFVYAVVDRGAIFSVVAVIDCDVVLAGVVLRLQWRRVNKRLPCPHLLRIAAYTLERTQKRDDFSRRRTVWSFHPVFGFCVSGIVVNTDKEKTRSFLLPVQGLHREEGGEGNTERDEKDGEG